ncbi:MAG TPA: SusC/RagA family TonB-linked outer membrane protein [Gemmatimonadaceae bacterium]
MSMLLSMLFAGVASAQAIAVTGTVTSQAGAPLQGVTVRVSGTETRVLTNGTGRYTITAPANGALNFTVIGQKPAREEIGGRTRIDVRMEPVTYLEEVVVTAYTEQRRADITGAVASINVESAQRETGASVLKRLDAVPGITVSTSGSPAGRSTVRIRGISSFQNNDPLYVIDGVPVQDSYVNWLNPADITSIQVLKDASAASIYGSRASNGVIVIETTKRGASGPPRMTLSARSGLSSPTKGLDDILITNAMDYFQVMKTSYVNANLPVPTNIYGDPNNPSLPAYIFAGPLTNPDTNAFGQVTKATVANYAYPNDKSLIMGASTGTNWWKAVFGERAPVGDYNLNVAGSGEDHTYGVSGNYFDQKGTAAYNDFRRGSVRANTQFNRGKFTFGENAAIAAEKSYGGMGDPGGYAEDGIMGKNIMMQPIIPIYDIAGNFAAGKATGLGNQSNPLKFAYERRNNINRNNKVFGNTFAGYQVLPSLALRSSIGFNQNDANFRGFNPITPENSEPNNVNSFNEQQTNNFDWTWTNTARYNKSLGSHTINLLAGQEANHSQYRGIFGSEAAFKSTTPDNLYLQSALGDASTMSVNSNGSQSALLSYFGKADYNFQDKYVANFTVRRDGSSRLGPDHRWGTFPAFGLGWRITKESFLENNKILSDAMLRFSTGITGNQQIPSGRILNQYGGDRGDTYYDIAGTNSSIVPGFRLTALGNPDLRWEENKATNFGADIALFNGYLNVIADFYTRKTNNLLFNPQLPATAGFVGASGQPIVNIGSMSNKGFDISIGHQGDKWNATLQGGHYKNTIDQIDGVQKFFYGPVATRFGNQVINKVGQPLGSFYGFVADGFFKDSTDIANSPKQDGAKPGRLRWKDVNGDGKITADDRTIIGSPHPKFTSSLDLGYRYGNFDISGTVFGSFGNDIFDNQKEWYVFREFSTNVRKDLLANSWTPTNLNAKYPRIDVQDNFSSAISSFYVEDGSYVRMRNLQLGYNVPASLSRWLSATRVYVQAENLFTITGYDGLDPSLPAADINGAAGDIRDQYRGVDRGVYPSSRTFSVGITASF